MASSFFSNICQKLKNKIWLPIKRLWSKTVWPFVKQLGSQIHSFFKSKSKSKPYSAPPIDPPTEKFSDQDSAYPVHHLSRTKPPIRSTFQRLLWELNMVTPLGQRIVGSCSVFYREFNFGWNGEKNNPRSKSALFGRVLYQWYAHRQNINTCLSTLATQIDKHGLFYIYHQVQDSSSYFYMSTLFLKPLFDCSIHAEPSIFFPKRNERQLEKQATNQLSLTLLN